MSLPHWDGTSQTHIEWDGVMLPCRTVYPHEDDAGFTASLPMENRCFLDLVARPDGEEPVTVHLDLNIYDDPRLLPYLDRHFFYLNIEHVRGKLCIVARALESGRGRDSLADAVTTPQWSCEVEKCSEVRWYLEHWGRLEVVLK